MTWRWKFAGALVSPNGIEPFEESVARAKCRFPFVAWGDSDSMGRPSEVDFGAVLVVYKLIEEHVSRGEGIVILDCHVVESAIVDAKSEFAAFFWNEEDGRCRGGAGFADEAFGEHLVDVRSEGGLFRGCEAIDAAEWGNRVGE